MADPQLVVRVAANLAQFQSNLAEGVSQIETYKKAMQQATASFDGSRIVGQAGAAAAAIQNAGGVTALTKRELEQANAVFAAAAEKLELMGKGETDAAERFRQLAAATQGAAEKTDVMAGVMSRLTSAALYYKAVEWGARLLEDAGHLQDLTERTGISVEALQRFKVIAEQSGSTIDAVSTAVFQMGKRLAGDDQGAAEAVRELGLNFAELRNSSPEEAFNLIGKAIGRLDDPFKQSELGARVFGKSVAELIPTFQHLNDEVAPYLTLSREQVKTVDDLGDSYVRVKASAVPWLVSLLDQRIALTQVSEALAWLNGQHGKAPEVTGRHAEAVRDLEKILKSAADNAIKPITDGLTRQSEIERELTAEHEKMAAAMAELDAAGVGWQGTLKGINGHVVEAIKFYLEAGVSQDKLATAYDLTAVQVRAVAESLKTYKAALQEIQKIEAAHVEAGLLGLSKYEQESSQKMFEIVAKGGESIAKIEAQLRDEAMKTSMSATDYQIAKIWEVVEAEKKAFVGSKEQRAIYYADIEAMATRNAQKLLAIQAVVNQAGVGGNFIAADPYGGSTGTTTGNVTAYTGFHQSLPINPTIGARASGGPVSAGQPYVVGERRPELFVPETNGTILPSVGGMTVNIHITQPLGTPAQLAQVIGEALMAEQRSLGVRFPTMTGTSR